MVVESVHCFLLVLVVAVELKGFACGVFVEEFGVVFYQPFCSSVAVKGNNVFLGQQQRSDEVVRPFLFDVIAGDFFTCLARPHPQSILSGNVNIS